MPGYSRLRELLLAATDERLAELGVKRLKRNDDVLSNTICPLSPQERVVLDLLAEGKTYSQIAYDLGLHTSTIGTHLHNIYGKLDVSDRANAVLKASQLGWLSTTNSALTDTERASLNQALELQTELTAYVNQHKRDHLSSKQHAYMDVFMRYARRPTQKNREALDAALAAILEEKGIDPEKLEDRPGIRGLGPRYHEVNLAKAIKASVK